MKSRIAYAGDVSIDWNREELAEGLACYRRGEFFVTHEHWESVWLTLEEPEKSFLQALIQMAAAFHHLESGNSAGTISLLRRSLRRLEQCPADFGGIAIAPLREEVSQWLHTLGSGTSNLPEAPPQINILSTD
jgi:predicted metal-dependent hydrolase